MTGERVTDDDKDVGAPFPRPSSATEMTRDDDDVDDARADGADEATTPSNVKDVAAEKKTKLCVFHQRGRCASGDACAYSHADATPPSGRRGRGHRTPRITHASNCGCRACRPERTKADEDKAEADGSSSEEEGAVPSDVVRREAEEKRRRDEEILTTCSKITQPSRVMFWRTFLHSAREGNGNKLLPYWKRDNAADEANDDRKASKRPRVDDVRDDAS